MSVFTDIQNMARKVVNADKAPTFPIPVAPKTPIPLSQLALAKQNTQQQINQLLAQHKAQLAANEAVVEPYNQLADTATGLPAQIEGAYGQAADRSAAYSQGFSKAFNETLGGLQADYNTKMGLSGSANTPVTPGLGDAIGYLRGGLQSAQTNMAGAGYGAAARLLPTLVRSQGLQAVGAANQSENTAFAKRFADTQKAGLKAEGTAAYQDATLGLKQDAASLAERKFADAQSRADAATARAEKYLAIAGDKALLAQADHLEKTDGYARTVDPATGEIVPYLADGKPVRTQAWMDKQRSLGQRDRALGQGDQRISIAQQNVSLANSRLALAGDNSSRSAAQYLANQLSKGTNDDGSKTIYTVRQTKDGWAVATALNPVNGKPLTAKQQGFTPTQERKFKVDAGVIAKSALNGVTSKPGNAEFFDAEGNVIDKQPNDPSKGWSQPVPGSNPPVYLNHHPPLSYDEAAAKLIVDGQYPPAIAYDALNRVYKPGQQGRPGASRGFSSVSPGYKLGDVGKVPANVKVAPGVNTSIVDSRLLSALGQLQNALGVEVQIISGYRTQQQQAAAYQRYVDSGFDPSMIAAKPGLSNHQRGQAVDVMVNGKAIGDVIPVEVLARFGLHNPVKGDGPHTTLLDVNG